MEALVAAAVAQPSLGEPYHYHDSQAALEEDEEPGSQHEAPSGPLEPGEGLEPGEDKSDLQLDDAQALDYAEQGGGPTYSGAEGIMEFPAGLPGQPQIGPKYKRGRGRSFFKEQPKKGAVCQVPGCDRSLHKLRDYYKRYKICPYHLELPCLVVEGQTIRFCQQCGRFQLLTDFEGDRRSCRRKLDKHNERRRKAEAEQKARMQDSGSDSPGSTRGTKAHRVSPYRAASGTKAGYTSMSGMFMGLGNGADLGSRLKALANDPNIREGIAPGLLQSLADPSMAGMDWLTAGGLENLGLGHTNDPMQPPPMPVPQSVTQDVQQQVLQQGPGILNSALLQQLQQLEQHAAPPPVQPQAQRAHGFGLFGGAVAAPPQQQQQHRYGVHQQQYGSQLPPNGSHLPPNGSHLPPNGSQLPPSSNAAAAAMLGPSLQQQLQLQHRPDGADYTHTSLDGASVFMQHMQQLQQAQQAPAPVPLLRSEPAMQAAVPTPAPHAAPRADGADSSDKAALLVALARTMGVSSQGLAKALADGSLGAAGEGLQSAIGGGPEQAQIHAQQQAQAQQVRQLQPQLGAVPVPTAQQQLQTHQLLQHQHQHQHQQALQHQHQMAMQGQALGSMGGAGSGAAGTIALLDGSRPGSLPPGQQPLLQQQPGSVFRPPASINDAGAASGLPRAGSEALPPQPSANGTAAANTAGPLGRQPLDLDQLQSAVQNSGLSPGFANDANLLLQLVAAVEAAQREAGPGKERMHSLSLKLFNCTPERLPKNILEQLEQWMVQNKSLLDGASRPGCVQLSVSALMSGQEFADLSDSFRAMVQRLASGGLGGIQTSILAQLDGRSALVDGHKQQLIQFNTGGGAGAATPEICSVRPLAVTPRYTGPILVTGRNIGDAQDGMFCRNGGVFPTTEILSRGPLMHCPEGPSAISKHWVLLRVPSLQEGCHQLEAQRGIFVSSPHSMLVLDDEEAVQELRQLEAVQEAPGCGVRDVHELLGRLGMVLRFARGALQDAGGNDPTLLARVARTAQDLAATCMLRGWGAVLRLVMPAACAGCTPAVAVAGIERQLGGMPLLHAAALTGGAAVVRALGAWAVGAGHELDLDARWGGGLSALHVATLLREPEGVAVALTELFPSTAPALWESGRASHGEETPLGLACRLDKRDLLCQLAYHGVRSAGAMLAALLLQDETSAAATAAAAAAASPAAQPSMEQRLPAGVGDPAEEISHQRRMWTQVCASVCDAEACNLGAEQPLAAHSWPAASAAGKPPSPAAVPSLCEAHPGEAVKSGQESPSSVLLSLASGASVTPTGDGTPNGCVTPADRVGHDDQQQPTAATESESGGGCRSGKGAAQQDKPASFYPSSKGQEQCSSEPQLDELHASGKGRGAAAEEEGSNTVCAFGHAATERRFRLWHTTKLAKLDSFVCAFLVCLLCVTLSLAPPSVRQQTHLWLLTTVGRAPLMLQPLLLLCQPAGAAYRRCRDSVVLGLHVAMFALQYWGAQSRSTDWITVNPVLVSYPAGLWMLVAVFTLQLRFALQAPALLFMFGANVLLMPAACQLSVGQGAASTVPSCNALGGVRLFAVVVVLPLLSAWLLEARARHVFTTVAASEAAA